MYREHPYEGIPRAIQHRDATLLSERSARMVQLLSVDTPGTPACCESICSLEVPASTRASSSAGGHDPAKTEVTGAAGRALRGPSDALNPHQRSIGTAMHVLTALPVTTVVPLRGVMSWPHAVRGGREVSVREATSDDAARIQSFIRALAPRTRYYRYCGHIRELSDDALERLVQADGARRVTLLALAHDRDQVVVGLGEYVADAQANKCEIALVVHDAWQRNGVGSLLLAGLTARACAASLRYVEGLVLRDNNPMLQFVRAHGFAVSASQHGAMLLRVSTTLGERGLDRCAKCERFRQLDQANPLTMSTAMASDDSHTRSCP